MLRAAKASSWALALRMAASAFLWAAIFWVWVSSSSEEDSSDESDSELESDSDSELEPDSSSDDDGSSLAGAPLPRAAPGLACAGVLAGGAFVVAGGAFEVVFPKREFLS